MRFQTEVYRLVQSYKGMFELLFTTRISYQSKQVSFTKCIKVVTIQII